jgi:hypothetical protein
MLSRCELALLLAWIAAAWWCARRDQRPCARAWRCLARFAQARRTAVLVVGLGAAGGSAGIAWAVTWPEPRIHDEFSYLLAADTFAQGRLGNPAHPLEVFFETFHVNQEPAYASMYPPVQGALLACGQVLGHPLVGVWLSMGLAGAALCWMLQGWLPPRWALLGALLGVARVGFIGSGAETPGYWSQSYWGGAAALVGGALVFGALPRLIRRPSAVTALVLALGIAILANTRPFEGLVVTVPVAALLLGWLVSRNGPAWPAAIARVILPMVLVLMPMAAGIAYYNWRLTGNALLLPYQLNGATYGIIPLFLWQPLGPGHTYHHAAIEAYHLQWAMPKYLALQTVSGYLHDVAGRLDTLFQFYMGAVLLIPVGALPWIWRKPWMRFALLVCGLLTGALMATTWLQPHYAAPATCLVVAVVVQGLRYLGTWRWQGRPFGRVLVQALPVVYLGLYVSAVVLLARQDPNSWHLHRARLLSELETDTARHVVIVRYSGAHSPHEEWVFNRADIDAARVIWARDMGSAANQALRAYYPERQFWLLEADAQPAQLVPWGLDLGAEPGVATDKHR